MSSPSYLMYLLVFKNPSSEQVEIIRDTFSNFDWSMGFAVEEVSIAIDGDNKVLKFQPKLVAAGYHTNRLRELMGLETEELQAKRILASFDRYRAREGSASATVNETAFKWLKNSK